MESRVIQLTSAAHKHGNLNIRPCGLDFFPKGILGGPTKANLGNEITIIAEGLPEYERTKHVCLHTFSLNFNVPSGGKPSP